MQTASNQTTVTCHRVSHVNHTRQRRCYAHHAHHCKNKSWTKQHPISGDESGTIQATNQRPNPATWPWANEGSGSSRQSGRQGVPAERSRQHERVKATHVHLPLPLMNRGESGGGGVTRQRHNSHTLPFLFSNYMELWNYDVYVCAYAPVRAQQPNEAVHRWPHPGATIPTYRTCPCARRGRLHVYKTKRRARRCQSDGVVVLEAKPRT